MDDEKGVKRFRRCKGRVGSRHLDARADHLVLVCCAKRGEVRRAQHECVGRVGLHVKSPLH